MNKGLGDKVESLIKKVAPTLSENYKECKGCKKRKEWLNNVGANFSNNKHFSE